MRRFLGLTAFLLTLTLLAIQAQEKTVILGGDTIAITVNYEGVYVSGMYDFEVNGGNVVRSEGRDDTGRGPDY